jgi:hydroxyacylglutathione hydrolase
MRIHPVNCGLGMAYLVELPQGLYLCDTGSPGQAKRILAKMKALGRSDLKVIWITHAHYDHYGNAAALRELTGALIGVHPDDAESLERGLSPLGTARHYGILFQPALAVLKHLMPLPVTRPDFTLEDGECLARFGWDATVLHTPGHTPGHTCLLLPGGIAFGADLIAGVPKKRVQYLVATDWSQLPGSLAHLQAAQPEWVYSGHSKQPMPGSIFQQIKAGE